MATPITIDIHHEMGQAAARDRLENGLDQITATLPGASLTSYRWEGDTLTFVVQAMGQRVSAKLIVLDTTVHAIIDLPTPLALLANTLKSRFLNAGTKLLR